MPALLVDFIKNHLPGWPALIAGYAVGILFFSGVNSFIKDFLPENFYRLALYLCLLLLWTLYWEHYRSCSKRSSKNKVGIIVSIYAEKVQEEEILKADFISRLEERIVAENLGGLMEVIVLKNHIAKKIQSQEAVNRINKRIRGQFYIYGNLKLRNGVYHLNLNSVVFHVPINERNKNMLSDDMNKSLVTRAQISEATQFQGFQYTADTLYLGVKYIVGIAAFISNSAEIAKNLHTALETELNTLQPLPPLLLQAKNRLPALLSDEYFIIAIAKYSDGNLPEAKQNLAEALTKYPNNYSALLLQSIIDFSVDNDAPKALVRLKNALKFRNKDRTIFYNLAFLQLWTGDYKTALKSCDAVLKTDKGDENDRVARESEQFNLKLIEDGKFRDQLYFWLGILNYREKRNYPQALEYFETFLGKATPAMKDLSAKATEYVQEVKNEIGI